MRSVLFKRSLILFLNFFLIILAYYQVKSASRSVFLEYWGKDWLPNIWIVSAVVLASIIGVYHRLVERFSRLTVVLGSLLAFMGLLAVLWASLRLGSAVAAFCFYVFVDIFSVILVEQFWSLTNSVNSTTQGRRSYWFIGTGGLIGGGAGGVLAAKLIEHTSMTTPDLLLSCALLLGVTLLLNIYIGRLGLYAEVDSSDKLVTTGGGWQALLKSRYLLLIAGTLLCAQLAQPIVEYQWAAMIEATYTDLDERTRYYGEFFGVLSLVAIGVNVILTPLIHRYLGIFAGMLTQPLMLSLGAVGFMAQTSLLVSEIMKISDRGLSYSINRASKELLYIPVDPVRTYQAKAWIDMLGYRLFKVLGSVLILSFLALPSGDNAVAQLGWLTLAICALWCVLIASLSKEYHAHPVPVAA